MSRRRLQRRTVLGLALGAGLAPGAAAWASEPVSAFRLGLIVASRARSGTRAFVKELGKLGWVEGRNLQLDYLEMIGVDSGRLPVLASELIGRGADAILAGGPEVALKSALAASRTVPIVMVAIDYDPLAHGYVASLARPGGNVTGVFLQQIELTAKRLDFLRETVPAIARVVVLWDRISADQLKAAQAAARSSNIRLDGVECTDPPYDYGRLLAGADGARGDALMPMTSPLFSAVDRRRLPDAALAHRLPSMFALREWVDAGGLMSYGPGLNAMYRLAARYVDRIAKGTKPADLPVQQPTIFELVVNLKTAKTLGLTVPPAILARASETIE